MFQLSVPAACLTNLEVQDLYSHSLSRDFSYDHHSLLSINQYHQLVQCALISHFGRLDTTLVLFLDFDWLPNRNCNHPNVRFSVLDPRGSLQSRAKTYCLLISLSQRVLQHPNSSSLSSEGHRQQQLVRIEIRLPTAE